LFPKIGRLSSELLERCQNENLVRKILKGNGKRGMGKRCPFSNSNSELELLFYRDNR
jgi:hypothetical protein